MKRFLLILTSFILCFVSFSIIPQRVFAEELIVTLQKDPPVPNENTVVIVNGCPEGAQFAEFDIHWEPTGGLEGEQKIPFFAIRWATPNEDGMAAVGFIFENDRKYWIDVYCGNASRKKALEVVAGQHSTTPDSSTNEADFPAYPTCKRWQTGGKGQKTKCIEVETGIGDINTDGEGFIIAVFNILLSISGGILFFIIIYSGYLIMTSRGNAEQLQKGREMLTSALVGFLFIVFSFVILEVLTVDILRLPGFKDFVPPPK